MINSLWQWFLMPANGPVVGVVSGGCCPAVNGSRYFSRITVQAGRQPWRGFCRHGTSILNWMCVAVQF